MVPLEQANLNPQEEGPQNQQEIEGQEILEQPANNEKDQQSQQDSSKGSSKASQDITFSSNPPNEGPLQEGGQQGSEAQNMSQFFKGPGPQNQQQVLLFSRNPLKTTVEQKQEQIIKKWVQQSQQGEDFENMEVSAHPLGSNPGVTGTNS